MTKKEMALTLARQYTEIEGKMWEMDDKAFNAKEVHGRHSSEYKFFVYQRTQFRSMMNTVNDSRKLLNVSNSKWTEAMKKVYIENGK